MIYPENEKLVKKLKRGDVASFDLIFKQFNQKVYNFCLHLLKNNSEAEEVTQEVFVALWQNHEHINIKSSLIAYIYGISRNIVYNRYRRTFYIQAYLKYLENTAKEFDFVTDDEILYNELSASLNKIIEQLPPGRKEVFKLNRIEGLTYKEVAAKLKISENTVDVQIRKAVSFIKKAYDKLY